MQVAHEVHHGTVSKDAERMSGQLDTFKSEIKHDVRFYLNLTSALTPPHQLSICTPLLKCYAPRGWGHVLDPLLADTLL